MSALVSLEGFETIGAESLKAARKILRARSVDLALVDLSLPDGSGMEIVRELQGVTPAEIVVATGNASIDSAVEALRLGAMDYLTKPIDTARLRAVLGNVARTRALKHEITTLRAALLEIGRFGPVVGSSRAMIEVYDLVTRAAPTEVPVLISGESGAGKEQVAHALHDLSHRRGEPFVAVNCGAIAPGLIESELFGHERGSFTGAVKDRRGFFEQASGGTLFLDEVTEMPLEQQVNLLRVLESGKVRRVGGERHLAVDVRLIAATNRDPAQAVEEGILRRDLYFRLNVFPIHLPPLRDREDDVVLLADHFLAELNKTEGTKKRFAPATLDRLRAYSWPGNVRELKNLVHRVYIVADAEIGPASLPEEILVPRVVGDEKTSGVGLTLEEAERRAILTTLEDLGGNKKKVAAVLGISLKTLYNKLASYGDSPTTGAGGWKGLRTAAGQPKRGDGTGAPLDPPAARRASLPNTSWKSHGLTK
jgi:DNA-binding NtrC family response regulator